MTSPMPPVVQQQLTRVTRRLFVQTLLDAVAWCLAGALLLATVWFLVEPFLPGSRTEAQRWGVAGALAGAALVAALLAAVLRAPGRLAAALLLDERFGLRERVTTALTLDPAQAGLPAGQALLGDVHQKVGGLDVAERFPVRLARHAALVPAAALLLAAVGVFYDPPKSHALPTEDQLGKAAPPNKAEIDKAMRDLEKKVQEKKPAEKLAGDKADLLDDELKKILNKPRDTQDEVRDRIKDMTKLEEKIRERQEALAEKAQAIKDQLKQMNQMAGMDQKNGPAKDLQKAVEKGDYKKAQEEVERLAKKMQNNELTEPEKEQLREQLKQLKEKLAQAANPDQQEEKLKELHREGKIDKDQLQQALDKIKKNKDLMSQEDKDRLKEMAEALQQCEQCMKEGDGDKASEALKKAGQCLKKMDDLDNLQELDEQLEQLAGCKKCMCKGVNNNPVPGQGSRPESEPHETSSFTSRIKGNFDPKGQKELTGYAPGTSFKKKSSAEIAGDIKQASQEAPEALDRQRIPRAAADMAKGYFENFRKLAGEGEGK